MAVSEGAMVFENELFQLIQYAPLTAQVGLRPLLIVPPASTSSISSTCSPRIRLSATRRAGPHVFLVSSRNPDAACAHLTWDDYLSRGVMKAIEVTLAVSAADKLNALGWCVGGTILSSALAVLRTRGDTSVASLTLLTTMLDFREADDPGVFIDERGVASREQAIGKGGLYPGA